jgi:dephospho-CoA kinase
MIIIGITGTLGSGKGTIVEYLVQQKGFVHFSVRAFIAEEIIRRGLPVNRDSLTMVGNDLRAANSPSYIATQLYERAALNGKNCVIESLRTPGEIGALRAMGGFWLFAVDADIQTRYKRITKRKSETDDVTFETFAANENREMLNIDPNKQNIRKCVETADYVFINDSSIDDLFREVEVALAQIYSEQNS